MNRTIFAKSVARRTALASVGAGVLGLLLRPLQAQEAAAPPKRLLIVHRPCGSVLERFFPAAGSFTLAPIIQAFEPLKSELVIVNGINCPRDTSWHGDQHAAALIAMMTGKQFTIIPGTDGANDPNTKYIVGADKSIDQHLLSKVPALTASPRLPSIQSTAYLPSNTGLPSFKVMSYKGNNQAQFPEVDAAGLFKSIFIGDNAGLTPEQIARKLDQNKSVLDRVHADLTRMQGLIPASQKPKLDAHLTAIQGLEAALQADGSAPTGGMKCTPPTQATLPTAPAGVTQDEAQHLVLAQNQLAIIQTAFQCDLTRVATFTYAHGNSDLRFQKIDNQVADGGGHHNISHEMAALDAQARIDQVYCEQFSAFLQKMQTVKESNGSLLDNTLVVFFNECAIGNTHSIENMPVLMLGGKNLGLQRGQHMQFGGRTMNDIWAAVCGAFGTDASFGDAAFTKGPVSGLFA
jgi:hypothetical protein